MLLSSFKFGLALNVSQSQGATGAANLLSVEMCCQEAACIRPQRKIF